jgi:PAS domain S-box-containing protein
VNIGVAVGGGETVDSIGTKPDQTGQQAFGSASRNAGPGVNGQPASDGVKADAGQDVSFDLPSPNGVSEIRASPFPGGDSAVAGIVVVTRDASGRDRSTQSRQTTEDFAQSALDALSAEVAILDADGNILAVNRTWRQFASDNAPVTENVNEGANYYAVCDAVTGAELKTAQRTVAGIRAVAAGVQSLFTMEYPCHAPGEKRWFTLRATPFHGDGPARVVVTHENITERKLAEDARSAAELSLRESNARFRRMVETTNEGVVEVDAHLNITYVNQRYCDLLGYTSDELIGKSAFDHFDEESRVLGRESWGKPLEGVSEQFDRRLRHKNGSTVWVIVSANPLLDSAGKVVGSLSMITDITERKQAEESLRRTEQEQRQSAEQLEKEHARLTAAQQVAKIGSWETDLSTLEVIWSEQSFRIFEADPVTFHPTHQAFLDRIHPEDRAGVNDAFVLSFDRHETCSVEHRLLLPSGQGCVK